MRCPKCGKEIDAKRNFCEYCGAQIKKNRKPLFITIAVVVCLFIFGYIGLTMYNKVILLSIIYWRWYWKKPDMVIM